MKRLLIIINICLMLLIYGIYSVTAAFSDNDIITFEKEINSVEFDGGVSLHQYETKSYNDGLVYDNRLTNYVVSYLEYSDQSAVKIINYSNGTYDSWSGGKVTGMASKFERNNPGWIVIGGVNGDFFHIQSNCQVMNLSMTLGDLYKPYIWNQAGSGVVGWKDNGEIVEGKPTISSKMYLDTDGESLIIDNVNVTPGEGITLLTKDVDNTYDLTGYNVYEITYTVHRCSLDGNSKKNKLFVSGTISDIFDGKSDTKIGDGFICYLVSKEKISNIEVGTDVKCQYHLTGEWEDVTNTTGYYCKILNNSECLFYNSSGTDYSGICDASYVNCKKNRTVIGKKSDGSTILMTIEYDKSGAYGCSYYEAASYLKELGCTDGWLLDGGGSTTMAVRDQYGNVNMVAGGSDGNERSDGNGIYFVIKDPGYSMRISDISLYSVTFDFMKNDSPFLKDVFDISLTIDDKTLNYSGNELHFDNLLADTEYTCIMNYKMRNEDGSVYQGKQTMSFMTDKLNAPTSNVNVSSTIDAAMFKVDLNESNNYDIVRINLAVDGKNYELKNHQNTIIEGLDKNTTYSAVLSCGLKDKEIGCIWNLKLENIDFKTTDKAIPLIKEFSIFKQAGSRVYFNYEIYNPGNLELGYEIEYLGLADSALFKDKLMYLDDIDNTVCDYDFKLILSCDGNNYESDTVILEKVSELPEGEKEENDNPPSENPTKKKKCGKKSNLIIELLSGMTLICVLFRKRK